VRYGMAEDRLYLSWLVCKTAELRLSMVNRNVGYFVAIDSFNENGISPGKIGFIG